MNEPGDDLHVFRNHSTGGYGGGSHAYAAGDLRLQLVERDRVLIDGDTRMVQGLFGDFTRKAVGP